MKIPCVSCQSLFRLDSRLVKSTGSLVRCSKCKYIFMVYPPTFNNEPITKDTNIDQSILFDLLRVERKVRIKGALEENSEAMNHLEVDEIASIEDFEEEEPDLEVEGIEHADLPDLAEYEKMIDWDDVPDPEDFTDSEKKFYDGGTQSLDINKV